jgi:hypothetical protein
MYEHLSKIKEKKAFYRDRYEYISRLLWIFILIKALLVILVLAIFLHRKPADYYASTMDGELVLLTPLNFIERSSI